MASTRKIHLDFHNPHWVESIGQHFDPEVLVKTWKEAHVNAVTVVFGLCACGNSYYESKHAPVHPGLQKDLLRQILPVAIREGIEVYVHFAPGINDRAVIEHPEWAMHKKDGTRYDTHQGTEWSGWGWVCYNSPFITEWLNPQLEEFVQHFPEVSGIFLDMVTMPEGACYCPACRKLAAEQGCQVDHQEDMDRFADWTLRNFIGRAREIVKSAQPQMIFTCNCRWYVGGAHDPSLDFIELEAPVTWGTHHYPIMSRYLRTVPKASAGMTTRFPFNWGYFGDVNSEAQLTFECAEIMATLGSCCIGDQLHPSGIAEEGVYELIGKVYAGVKEREPWTIGANTVPFIGVMADWQQNIHIRDCRPDYYSLMQKPAAFYGAGLALLEGSRHFDVLDEESSLGGYRIIWLPENITLSTDLIPKMQQYVENGGCLLVTGPGLWRQAEWRSFLERIGQVKLERIQEDALYTRPLSIVSKDIPAIPYYVAGDAAVWSVTDSENHEAASIIAYMVDTYQSISIGKKFSHYHPPADQTTGEAAAVVSRYGLGKVAYWGAAAAEHYFRSGSSHIRKLLLHMIDALLDPKSHLVKLPSPSSSIEISLMEQENRWILHVIQFSAKRHTGATVIDDVPIRRNIPVELRPPHKPKSVYEAPSRTEVPYTISPDGLVSLTLPELHIHSILVMEW